MDNEVISKDDLVTKEQLKVALPKEFKGRVTDDIVDTINDIISNPEMRELYRENFVTYTNVLSTGKYTIQQYIDAVRYVSYKILGSTNIEAYAKTFPDRYKRLVAEGIEDKNIASYATAYNKGQLVNKIYEQTLIPTHVLNADIFQKAINTQAYLMMNANSEKVRSDAANSLLTHLKRPEAQKVELNLGIREDKSIDALRESTMALVAQQKLMIESGMSNTREIAHSKIIQGEVVDE